MHLLLLRVQRLGRLQRRMLLLLLLGLLLLHCTLLLRVLPLCLLSLGRPLRAPRLLALLLLLLLLLQGGVLAGEAAGLVACQASPAHT